MKSFVSAKMSIKDTECCKPFTVIIMAFIHCLILATTASMAFAQSTATKECCVFENASFMGAAMTTLRGMTSVDDCKARCMATIGCSGFSLNAASLTCALYTTANFNMDPTPGITSVILDCCKYSGMLPVFAPGVATELIRIGMESVQSCQIMCKATSLCNAFAYDPNTPSRSCILISALLQGTMTAMPNVDTYMLGCTPPTSCTQVVTTTTTAPPTLPPTSAPTTPAPTTPAPTTPPPTTAPPTLPPTTPPTTAPPTAPPTLPPAPPVCTVNQEFTNQVFQLNSDVYTLLENVMTIEGCHIKCKEAGNCVAVSFSETYDQCVLYSQAIEPVQPWSGVITQRLMCGTVTTAPTTAPTTPAPTTPAPTTACDSNTDCSVVEDWNNFFFGSGYVYFANIPAIINCRVLCHQRNSCVAISYHEHSKICLLYDVIQGPFAYYGLRAQQLTCRCRH